MQIGAVGDRYKEFLHAQIDSGARHIFMCGGRRSAKTFTTYIYLELLGGVLGNVKIMVVCCSFPQLQKTMEDFEDALNVPISGNVINGYTAKTRGNVTWQFAHFDSKEKAQGTKCDILFMNEAVNVQEEVADTLLMGVRLFSIYNFNPTKHWWGEKYVEKDGSNLIVTTWKDNPHLTQAQRDTFEAMKERALRPNATRHDIYQYQVYYLGNYANMVGTVFGSVERCTVRDYHNVPAEEFYGLDFGFATDGDPTVLVGVKLHQGKIYAHQYIYEQGLVSDEELGRRMIAHGIDSYTQISADFGGMGKGRIRTLRTADDGHWVGELAMGFSITNAIKTKIIDGIGQMLSFDAVVITDTSAEMIQEFEGYELDENNKPHGADHAIDAVRYAFQTAKINRK